MAKVRDAIKLNKQLSDIRISQMTSALEELSSFIESVDFMIMSYGFRPQKMDINFGYQLFSRKLTLSMEMI